MFFAPPPAARLATIPVREVAGAILVWHGPLGVPPWEVELPEDHADWGAFKYHKMTFRTHPQEVTENSVDIGHLRVLHQFKDVELTQPLTVDGPRLRTSYSFTTKPLPLIPDIKVHINVRVDGLGFSLVELTVAGGWALRQLILPTPISAEQTTIWVATAVKKPTNNKLPTPGNLLATFIGEAVLMAVVQEVNRDRKIWEHKAYLARPAIAAGDGPIATYRRWARQFYDTQQ